MRKNNHHKQHYKKHHSSNNRLCIPAIVGVGTILAVKFVYHRWPLASILHSALGQLLGPKAFSQINLLWGLLVSGAMFVLFCALAIIASVTWYAFWHPHQRLDQGILFAKVTGVIADQISLFLILALIIGASACTSPAAYAFLISVVTLSAFLMVSLDLKVQVMRLVQTRLFKAKPDPKSKFHHSQPRDCLNRRNANLPRLRR